MKVKIIQSEVKPHAVEIIADSIVKISAAMKKISESRLSQDAIVTLVARNSNLPRADIVAVLENLETLEERWLKKPVISKSKVARLEIDREAFLKS